MENVFSDEEVNQIRTGFHHQLLDFNIHHDQLLAGQEEVQLGPRLKSGVATIFYNKWKLDAHLYEKVYTVTRDLLVSTFGSGIKTDFIHPLGKFNDVLAYIDRVCYRLPDSIRPEYGLEMHVDRNPTNPYLTGTKNGLKKWRPIQAILTLTDHYGSDCGGLKVVKGFHKITDEYFKGQHFEGDGEFCRLTSKSHTALEHKLETTQAPKGSLIFWDNRLPHATCQKLAGSDTREVIYIGYLPDIPLNREYCQAQWTNLQKNIHPPAYLKDPAIKGDRNWSIEQLSPLQKKLLLCNE